jgi:diguanylate cyclase (GGDEF)-like protein/PAS domain S-box-containing protein
MILFSFWRLLNLTGRQNPPDNLCAGRETRSRPITEICPEAMLRVYDCLTTQHDWRLVALAGLICFAVCCAAFGLLYRARKFDGTTRVAWLAVAGVSTGSGIWATHFVALLAFDRGPPLTYRLPETALSLIVAVAITTAGFAWWLYGRSRFYAAAAGCLVGAGIAAMHYAGIAALDLQGEVTWIPNQLAASMVVVAVFAAAALYVASGAENGRRLLAAAALLTSAILAHHFTALSAASIPIMVPRLPDPNGFSQTSLAFAIATVAALVIGMCSVAVWMDRRTREEIDRQNVWLDLALNNMNQGLCMFDTQKRLMVWNARYTAMYRIAPEGIWTGCTLDDILHARAKAGTLPLDCDGYSDVVRSSLSDGLAFIRQVELNDGRIIAVVSQPIVGGGMVATHEDITERTRAQRDLEQTRAFLDTIIENVPAPIIVKDAANLRYRLINRAAEKYYGADRAAMLGRTTAEVMPEATARTVNAEDRKIIDSGKPMFIDEHAIVTPGNGTRIVTATRLPVLGPEGSPKYLITVIDDVTERKRSEQRIAHMAHHDLLTELPNRAAFNENLAETMDAAAVSKEAFAVLCVDLDRFKAVNDVYGHALGDRVLSKVAVRLGRACHGAFLARVGGDEFVVISPPGPHPATAEALAERLAAEFVSDLEIDGRKIPMGVTIGIAIYPQNGADAATLVGNADAALYRAKAEVRGSIRFFDASMDRQLREKRALEQDLRTAIADEQLTLFFQPQAKIDGSFTGFEALLRWRHPRLGMVSPATFIPLAEETGLIVTIGEWVLRTACREAASWPNPLHIAVNLSPVQFERGDLAALVHEILLETGLAPSRLELEITEGVLIGDFNRALATLRRLKGLGVRIAMDDFGIGYSSLSYLQSFPFDKLKIDQSFVANLNTNRQSASIVKAVIALSRGLNVPVLAEGVETQEQLKFLTGESCDEVQGYLIGRPHPIAHYAQAIGRAPMAKSLAAAG